MNLLWYSSVSFIEYAVVFYLMFRLFGFRLRWQAYEILLVCALLTFTSYTLDYGYDLAWLNPFILIMALVSMLWMILKIELVYAVIMSTAFIIHFMNKTLIYEILYYLGRLGDPRNLEMTMTIVLAASALTILVGWVVQIRPRFQFTFIPLNPTVRISNEGHNRLLPILIVIQILIVGSLYYLLTEEYHLVFSIGSKIAFALAIYILYLFQKIDDQV
jgi:hypothetical protein